MRRPPSLPSALQVRVALRRLALVGFDGLLIVAAFVGAFALRLVERDSLRVMLVQQHELLLLALASGLPVLLLSGWYRGLTRYTGSHSLYTLIPRTTLMVVVLLAISTVMGAATPPRSFWILYWMLFTGSAIASRIVMRDLLLHQLERSRSTQGGSDNQASGATLIYGAGSSGVSLLMALRNDPRFSIDGFLDDDAMLHGRSLQNLRIHCPSRLPELIDRNGISQVLLALPSVSRERKRLLVDQLTHRGLKVLSIPSLGQLASGERIVTDLQPVSIEDLLGREPSTPDPRLLKASVLEKVVLVTGAGGSIGSELCRQIVNQGARTLLLVDRNEFGLYTIEQELLSQQSATELVPVLGDASVAARLVALCRRYGVETIFHAAAYKHVPMVEANLCSGVANNIRTTNAVIEAARISPVERLILISTDKAVRPTNAMGASKRVCELLIQAAAAEIGRDGPILTMVRFGNVLGSSGSVIPLFHRQIAAGGPVTVTHPAITRYFMTIPEAVQLVLQAAGMAGGGDLFLLEMGEPVRIADLARQMIELSGLRVKDEQTPDGDIAIHYTGLRPGEKLYEELLIGAQDEPTAHPLIRRAATEPLHSRERLDPLLERLELALDQWDEEIVADLLRQLVPEYRPEKRQHSPRVPQLAREAREA